ncbi:MAG TPA: hypothetical protein VH482_03800 [Thermomicrobiales bacterium]|jgi:hypothetical protein
MAVATVRSNVAVLCSETSRREYVRQAKLRGETYRFTGARGGEVEWLKGEYAYLAPNALASALHRCEVTFDTIGEGELVDGLAAYATLFVPNAGYLRAADIDRIAAWLDGPDRFLVVTGKTNLPAGLLGVASREDYEPAGYTGWRWCAASPFGGRDTWEDAYVSGYRGYTCARVTAAPGSTAMAELVELTGDLSAPATATVQTLGHAIVTTDRSLYVANQVFEYLGGVLQAHLNVEEVRLWSNATHWGDTLVYFLREALRATPARRLWQTTLCPFGSYDGVLQLRHDVDHEADQSIDLSMLDYEVENAVPASYYVMDPAFCSSRCTPMGGKTWVEETARYNFIEAAQHNDSTDGDPPRWITGTGLSDHIRQSDLTMGTASRTAGRHMGFLVYPETIDAMAYLYDETPDLLGLCTFSLYDVLAYGERNPEVVVHGKQITYSTYDHAKPSVPAAISGYWFPYHAVVSTVDEHRSLPGWDVTHDTDCDYDRIEQLFAGRNSKLPSPPSRLDNGVFTIQYESQLGRDPRENRTRGHLPWLRYAVAHAERHNFWITTKRELYERMNDYQDAVFRVDGADCLTLHNPTTRAMTGLTVRTSRPVNTVTANGRRQIHIVDHRIVTLPPLGPGETVEVTARWEETAPPTIGQPNTRYLEIGDAQFCPESGRVAVHGRAIRQGRLVVGGLPPARQLIVQVGDNRGQTRTRLTVAEDGVLVVPVLGQHENVMSFGVEFGIE